MRKSYLTLPLLLAISLLPLSSWALEIGARGYYWFPSLDGTVKVDEAGVIGTTVNFDEDLGIEDENFPCAEVFIDAGKHHFSLAYTDIDYSGRKTLSRSIVFDGKTYTVNSLVTSSIEYQMIDFHYQYDFLDFQDTPAGASLGGVFHVKYLDGEVALKTTGLDEKEDFAVPIPMVGLNLHLGILKNILEARVRGTAMSYSGNTIFEIMADISWNPFPFIGLHGGYRVFSVDIDEDDVVFDYDMSGPYAALTISF